MRHEILDLDKDLQPEIRVASASLVAWIKPGYGGALIEMDYRPGSFNLTNALARRPEAYHRRLKINAGNSPCGRSPRPSPIFSADRRRSGGHPDVRLV